MEFLAVLSAVGLISFPEQRIPSKVESALERKNLLKGANSFPFLSELTYIEKAMKKNERIASFERIAINPFLPGKP